MNTAACPQPAGEVMDRTDRKNPYAPQYRYNGLCYADFNTLATYNAERAHGIVHTPEWDNSMAELQRRFDEGERTRREQ